MDRLEELEAFVAVVDAGSLAAAGRQLRRSAPAMTRALAGLEARTGVRLIERTTRRLHTTAAGEELATGIRALLHEYQSLVSQVADGPLRGVIRVTAPLVFGQRHVTPAVVSFLQQHPLVHIDLVLDDRERNMVGEGLDVAVRIGALSDLGLVARKVGAVRRVLVATPVYLAQHPSLRSPADLQKHVLVSSSLRLLEWRFQKGGKTQVLRFRPRLLVNGVESSLVAIHAGFGVGRALSYQVSDALRQGTLVRVLPEFEPPALPVQVVFPREVKTGGPRAAFRQHLVRQLKGLRGVFE